MEPSVVKMDWMNIKLLRTGEINYSAMEFTHDLVVLIIITIIIIIIIIIEASSKTLESRVFAYVTASFIPTCQQQSVSVARALSGSSDPFPGVVLHLLVVK